MMNVSKLLFFNLYYLYLFIYYIYFVCRWSDSGPETRGHV